jgi:hypothetical protein
MADLNMSEAFRAGCEKLRISDAALQAGLQRSQLTPAELLTIDETSSSRNFKVSYVNKAGETKWVHLFMVPGPVQAQA